jgi:hypothetical protein
LLPFSSQFSIERFDSRSKRSNPSVQNPPRPIFAGKKPVFRFYGPNFKQKTWATASRSVIGNAVEERGTSTKFGGITAVNVALG